ncbi:MAG TPA: hypothetical protein VII56_21430 [Rhizomicrobium sp.]
MTIGTLSALLAEIKAQARHPILSSSVVMAGRRISLACDEPGLFGEFFTMFGAPEPVPGPPDGPADMDLTVRSRTGSDFGWFHMAGDDGLPLDGVEFQFSVSEDSGHFEIFEQPDPTWTCFAFRGTAMPAFAFHERDCLFSLEPRWRSNIMWLLFWRLLRIRADTIFFHASALGMSGQGTMLVGPSGAGKSTTALALAARGHNFLSDEVAAYVPASGALFPFRRPVGIKPGPRSDAVERGLSAENAGKIARDGFVRFDVNTLFAVEEPRPVPLRNVVFLRGFADKPLLSRISPGRGEIAELQPLMSSFLNAPHGRRIFELSRLLSAANVYELRLGGPDETAAYLERAIG